MATTDAGLMASLAGLPDTPLPSVSRLLKAFKSCLELSLRDGSVLLMKCFYKHMPNLGKEIITRKNKHQRCFSMT